MTLAAEDVSLTRGGRRVLDGIWLTLAPGRFTAILGPNGAGKSTLLKVLAGDLAPGWGRVRLDGRDLRDWRAADLARRRAVLPQETEVGFAFTAHEVAAWGGRELPGAVAAALADQALAEVEARDFAHRPVTRLSGGERRRVHLARALVQIRAAARTGPAPILLLDEPTAGLDPRHQHGVLELAAGLARQGSAVAAVLHDLDLAARYADDLVLLGAGRIAAHGPPEAVLRPELVAALYGVRTVLSTCPGSGRTCARIVGRSSCGPVAM